jgi:hypothetical protein
LEDEEDEQEVWMLFFLWDTSLMQQEKEQFVEEVWVDEWVLLKPLEVWASSVKVG